MTDHNRVMVRIVIERDEDSMEISREVDTVWPGYQTPSPLELLDIVVGDVKDELHKRGES